MYRGSNPTALQSQQWLTESLIAWMKEKPFSQITVQEIARRADLSRQTFYNFFSSKEEVLRLYLQRQCEARFAGFREAPCVSVEDMAGVFADVLQQNEELLDAMLANGLENIVAGAVSGSVALFARRFVNKAQPPAFLPYSEALLSGALAQLIVFWFQQEKPISIEELTHLLEDFLLGRLFGLRRA